MDDVALVTLIILIMLAIPIARYFIWRSRYAGLTQTLKTLTAGQSALRAQIDEIEEWIKRQKAGSTTHAAKSSDVFSPTTLVGKMTVDDATGQEVEIPPDVVAVYGKLAQTPRPIEAPPTTPPAPAPWVPVEPFGADRMTTATTDMAARQARLDLMPRAEEPAMIAAPEPIAAARPSAVAAPPARSTKERLTRAGQKAKALILGKDSNVTDWESLIGGKWLNLIGMVVLVVGIVLLTQQALLSLPPAGKIALGAAFSVMLIVGGVLLERLTLYQRIGRTFIGGGWALLYFDAFAAYNIQEARIIDDPRFGLAALSSVAAGMIIQSLRYRSQLVTGLAYGLGFLAIVLTPVTLVSLAASGLLAASLIVVARTMSWHHLAAAGVAGTYLNHWLWLEKITKSVPAAAAGQSMSGLAPEQGFWLSSAILLFYWLLFAAVSLNRSITSERDKTIYFGVNLANSAGMLGLMALQIHHQYGNHFFFYVTGPAALAYAALAYLDRRVGQINLFLANATIAVILYAISLPLAIYEYGWNPSWVSPYLMVGSLLALFAGLRAKAWLLRGEGYALSALSFAAALAINLQQSDATSLNLVWFAVPVLIVVFQALSEWHGSQPPLPEQTPSTSIIALVYGIGATLLLAHLLWNHVHKDLIGLVWLAIGLVLFEAGTRRTTPALRIQGYLLAGLAFPAILGLNFGDIGIAKALDFLPPVEHTAPRPLVVITALIAYYYLYWRESAGAARRQFRHLPSYAATLLVILLAFQELDRNFLAGAFILSAVILVEAGLVWRDGVIRLQGFGLSALALAAAMIVNIYAWIPEAVETPLNRFVAPLTAVGLYYIFERFGLAGAPSTPDDRRAGYAASAGATLLVALILWKELPSLGVAPAWCFFGLALFELSLILKTPVLRAQAHVLVTAAFVRLFMANFIVNGAIGGLSYRLVTIVPVILSLYYLRLRLLDLPVDPAFASRRFSILRGETRIGASFLSYAGALLIVILCRFEFGRAHAVAAWAPLVLIFLVLGQRYGDRDLRYQSYLLALYAFFRGWSTNIYLEGSWLHLPERISTTVPMVAALFIAALLCRRRQPMTEIPSRGAAGRLAVIDNHARTLYALLASVFLAVLLFYQLSIDLVSIGWAIEGLALLTLGFALNDRDFRLFGLALLFICLLKVTFIDLAGVETLYRILSFIMLGLILLLASLGYTRYRDVVGKYI